MENVRKHRDVKLVTKEKRRNYLVSESNFHWKFLGNRNEENSNVYEKNSLLGFINIIIK